MLRSSAYVLALMSFWKDACSTNRRLPKLLHVQGQNLQAFTCRLERSYWKTNRVHATADDFDIRIPFFPDEKKDSDKKILRFQPRLKGRRLFATYLCSNISARDEGPRRLWQFLRKLPYMGFRQVYCVAHIPETLHCGGIQQHLGQKAAAQATLLFWSFKQTFLYAHCNPAIFSRLVY